MGGASYRKPTMSDIRNFLEAEGIPYQSYMDITECLTEGSEKGERLLDFLTIAANMLVPRTHETEIGAFYTTG